MKYSHAVFLAFALVLIPFAARAAGGLQINEIMYDLPGTDSGHEWIELYNAGTSSVTLVGGSGSGSFRFSDGSNHYLAQTALQGSMAIAPGGYLILADDAPTFLSDYPGFAGSVVDTTMSLPNAGGTAKVVDGSGNIVDSVTYASSEGASADGNSLQLASGTWIAAAPTPGAVNATMPSTPAASPAAASPSSTVTSSTSTSDASGPTSSSTSSSGGLPASSKGDTSAADIPHMTATLTAPIAAVAGIPITASAVVYGTSGEYRAFGRFHYAFGDGTDAVSGTPAAVTHTYQFPGTYAIDFEFAESSYVPAEISVRQVITVSDPQAVIAGVHADGSVDIKNPDDSEADISNWSIRSLSDQSVPAFTFPSGTTLMPGVLVTVPASVIGFSPADAVSVELVLPSGARVMAFGAPDAASSAMTPVPAVMNADASMETVPAISPPPPPAVAASAPISNTAGSKQRSYANGVPQSSLPADANAAAEIVSAVPLAPRAHSLLPFIIGILGLVGVSYVALRRARALPCAGSEGESGSVPQPSGSDTQHIAESIRIIENEER